MPNVRVAKATARDVSRPRPPVREDTRDQWNAEFDELKCSHCLNSRLRMRGYMPIAASGPPHRDAHDDLAEIAPVKHADEGFRCVFQAVYDVLAIANAAVGNAGADLPLEIGVV